MSKYTTKTLEHYRDQGMIVDIVERWLPMPGHPGGGMRKDFLGLIDLIAFSPEKGIIGIQSFGSEYQSHWRTVLEKRDILRVWLQSGGQFHLIGWRKLVKERGSKLKIYKPRIQEINLTDLEEVE